MSENFKLKTLDFSVRIDWDNLLLLGKSFTVVDIMLRNTEVYSSFVRLSGLLLIL